MQTTEDRLREHRRTFIHAGLRVMVISESTLRDTAKATRPLPMTT